MHWTAPVKGWYCPPAQNGQLAEPVLDWARPEAQKLQVEAFADEYEPTGQEVKPTALAPQKLPATHGLATAAPLLQ